MRIVLAWLALLAVAAPDALAGVAEDGRIDNSRLTEISGIAASNRHDNVIWAVNDSGNPPELFAFNADGSDRGRVRVNGVHNFDWEDLDSFVLDGQPYLLIADVGDNRATRRISYLIIVSEPRLPESGLLTGAVEPVTRIAFRYEDGPRDCEAVAVDTASDRIILIGKRGAPAPVYELPLTLANSPPRPLVAYRIGTLGGLPRPTPREMLGSPLGPWRHQPTGLDLRADGAEAAVITYQNVYLFRRHAAQNWAEALGAAPEIIALELSQTESVAYLAGKLVVVAEGRNAPLLILSPN